MLDRVIHEPARLRILMVLSGLEECDFKFLKGTIGLTNGNLSAHVDRLESAGFVEIQKGYRGKVPHTIYRMTDQGTTALSSYWQAVDEIRSLARPNTDNLDQTDDDGTNN